MTQFGMVELKWIEGDVRATAKRGRGGERDGRR
jgi:hypothetical protein